MNQFHQPWKLIPSHVRGKGGREIGRFRGDQLAKDLPDGSECWVGAVNTVNNPPADNPYKGCSKVILPDGQRLYLFEAIDKDTIKDSLKGIMELQALLIELSDKAAEKKENIENWGDFK